MPLWNRLRQELDRAGHAAQGAIDEGRVRLEAFRARQLADKAAQAIGYAVYRARQRGHDVDADTYARLSSTLASHEATAATLEAQLDSLVEQRRATRRGTPPGSAGAEPPTPPPPGA